MGRLSHRGFFKDSSDLPAALTVGVLPVMAHPPTAGVAQQLSAVADWFAIASGHQCRLSFTVLPAIFPQRPLSYFAVAGGMGAPPQNSQFLVRAALDGLAPGSLAALAQMQGRLLVLTQGRIKPHTWHLCKGGKRLVSNIWCDRYAIVPVTAPLGTIAHELGHLLFDWPDLTWTKGLADECLMAQGASVGGGQCPSPPCGPLRVQMGWCQTCQLHPSDPVLKLAFSTVGLFRWRQTEWLIEYRPAPRPRLLLYHSPTKAAEAHPQLLKRIALGEEDGRRSVLGLVAPYLRNSGFHSSPSLPNYMETTYSH